MQNTERSETGHQHDTQHNQHLDLGASTVYLWGGASDIWYQQGKCVAAGE